MSFVSQDSNPSPKDGLSLPLHQCLFSCLHILIAPTFDGTSMLKVKSQPSHLTSAHTILTPLPLTNAPQRSVSLFHSTFWSFLSYPLNSASLVMGTSPPNPLNTINDRGLNISTHTSSTPTNRVLLLTSLASSSTSSSTTRSKPNNSQTSPT